MLGFLQSPPVRRAPDGHLVVHLCGPWKAQCARGVNRSTVGFLLVGCVLGTLGGEEQRPILPHCRLYTGLQTKGGEENCRPQIWWLLRE